MNKGLKVSEETLDVVADITQRYVANQLKLIEQGKPSKWVAGLSPDVQKMLLEHSPDKTVGQRRDLHRDYLQGFLDGLSGDKPERPKLFLVVGSQGSGKSFFVNSMVERIAQIEKDPIPDSEFEKVVQIYEDASSYMVESNFDFHKDLLYGELEYRLPEIVAMYPEQVSDLFPFIRPEASGLDNAFNKITQQYGINLLMQQTLRGASDAWVDKQKEEFDIVLIGVTNDLGLNALRFDQRNKDEGREVPFEQLAMDIVGFSGADGFQKLLPHAQHAILLQNDQDGFRPIWKWQNGVEVDRNPEQVERFISYANLDQQELTQELQQRASGQSASVDLGDDGPFEPEA